MESMLIIEAFASLLIVIGIFIILAVVLKKYMKVFDASNFKSQNISVKHLAIIDVKRRIVEVTYEDKKFLLLLGNNDLVLNIQNVKTKEK